MSGTWGRNIKLSIFGESHNKGVGIVIDGLKPGIELDLEKINMEMKRRAPGRNAMSTPRGEKDEFDILSGYFEGKTTGTPLCAVIWNKDVRSKDYSSIKDFPRPGHGDYTGFVKYNGFNDYRGGGHFSGRLTAPIVFAGAIAKQILEQGNIVIGSHVKRIGQVEDSYFDKVNLNEDILKELVKMELPVLEDFLDDKMREEVLKAKEEEDSVGGIIEAAVLNLPAGLGDPFFDSVESILSHLLFSIPAVKGVEFGAGFDISAMKGSQANDEYYVKEGVYKTTTNNNGGILGGITSGMPLIFRAAIKPTPSIGKMQRTVNLKEGKDADIRIEGRHDPCIVPRAVPVIEAAAALAILDFYNNLI